MADEKITKPTGDVRMENNKREYNAIEIEVAENMLAKGYKWIARDKNDTLCAYKDMPVKGDKIWENKGDWFLLIPSITRGVIPLFESIQWEDDDPVSLHDVVPRILTDEEKSYIQTVIAPFRERINFVKVYYGNYYGKFIYFSVYVPEEYQDTCGSETCYSMLVDEDSFLGMEENREYSLEELEV